MGRPTTTDNQTGNKYLSSSRAGIEIANRRCSLRYGTFNTTPEPLLTKTHPMKNIKQNYLQPVILLYIVNKSLHYADNTVDLLLTEKANVRLTLLARIISQD